MPDPSSETRKRVVVARLVGVGWFVAISIAGGAIGGLALDNWLGTGPVLTIVGVLAGVAVAVAGMFRMLLQVWAVEDSPKKGQK